MKTPIRPSSYTIAALYYLLACVYLPRLSMGFCVSSRILRKSLVPIHLKALTYMPEIEANFPFQEDDIEDDSSLIHNIDSIGHFLQVVQHDDEQLCVVKYTTTKHYCKTCQRVHTKFQQIAREYGQTKIRCANVEVTQHSELASHITRLPFVEIYRRSELLASFSTGRAYNFPHMVRKAIDYHSHMSSEERRIFREEHAEEIRSARDRLEVMGQIDRARKFGI